MTSALSASPVAGAPPSLRPLSPVAIGLTVGAHVILGLALRTSPTLATAHALATLLAVVWIILAAKTPGPIVAAAGYVTGAEVLWRETSASIPWEFSKYMLIAVCGAGIVKFVGRPSRSLPVWLFLAALTPAAVIPVLADGPLSALEPLAFNLAGLLALAVAVLFLSRLAGPWDALAPVVWAFVAPVVATATIATSSVRGLSASDFFNDSNFLASGGFGPNQVSALLGLGALLLILTAVRESRRSIRVIAIGMSLWFVVQAMLTFSRGGVLNVVVAMAFALPFLVARRDLAARMAMLIIVGIVTALLLLPGLESLTGGNLGARFSDTRQADRRSALIAADFETFEEHPLLGVGVGQAENYRLDRLVIASHTEYTRLLAEHGLFGIIAIGCLVAMVAGDIRRQKTAFGYAWSVALVAWTATELWHASTRLAATPFAFALAAFTIIEVRKAIGAPDE